MAAAAKSFCSAARPTNFQNDATTSSYAMSWNLLGGTAELRSPIGSPNFSDQHLGNRTSFSSKNVSFGDPGAPSLLAPRFVDHNFRPKPSMDASSKRMPAKLNSFDNSVRHPKPMYLLPLRMSSAFLVKTVCNNGATLPPASRSSGLSLLHSCFS